MTIANIASSLLHDVHPPGIVSRSSFYYYYVMLLTKLYIVVTEKEYENRCN